MESTDIGDISLCEIDKDNWKDAITLTVSDKQKGFVASNLHSIAEASFHEAAFSRGIVFREKMIGYTLLFNPEDNTMGFIVRFMIDKNYQGFGYGKQAMILILSFFKGMGKAQVELTVLPENEDAQIFYEKVGFADTGDIRGEEKLYRIDL